MTDYNDIPVEDDGIKLGQFLKLADLVDSGSEAKQVLAGGVVRVNGDIETRTTPPASTCLASEPESTRSASLRNWPSLMPSSSTGMSL